MGVKINEYLAKPSIRSKILHKLILQVIHPGQPANLIFRLHAAPFDSLFLDATIGRH
jgi:hypothetical protein